MPKRKQQDRKSIQSCTDFGVNVKRLAYVSLSRIPAQDAVELVTVRVLQSLISASLLRDQRFAISWNNSNLHVHEQLLQLLARLCRSTRWGNHIYTGLCVLRHGARQLRRQRYRAPSQPVGPWPRPQNFSTSFTVSCGLELTLSGAQKTAEKRVGKPSRLFIQTASFHRSSTGS